MKEFKLNDRKLLISYLRGLGIIDIEIKNIIKVIQREDKEFIKLLKKEFKKCRDETDIWGDGERWGNFERMFMKKINKLVGADLK